ncbi:MAG: DUF4398 domain-containing protein [Thermoanaerobaculia bacterium]
MKKVSIVVLLGSALAVGCASTGPPVDAKAMTDAELELRAAESAGAGELATDLLAKARRAYDAARRASAAGNGEEARDRLLEARAYADAAESRARAEKLRTEVARFKREADELEMRTRRIRERAPGGAGQ